MKPDGPCRRPNNPPDTHQDAPTRFRSNAFFGAILYEEMQAQWLTHVITYNSLISAFTKAKLYETMQSQRLTQVITYNALISAFVEANPYETMQSEWLTPVIVCSSTLPRNITDAPLPILVLPPIFSGGSLNALTRVLVLSCLLWAVTGVSAALASHFFSFLLFRFFCRLSQVGA